MRKIQPFPLGKALGLSVPFCFRRKITRGGLYLLLLGLLANTFTLQAQAPVKHWDAVFGGNASDMLRKAIPTSDGGYLLAGSSASPQGGDKTVAGRGGMDFWVVKINSLGEKVWDRVYGGIGSDVLTTAIATSDGGFLLGGTSDSPKGHEKSEMPRGSLDYWIVKINASGVRQWDKTIGGDDVDELGKVVQNADGSFLLGGTSRSERSGEKSQNSATHANGEDHFRNWDDYWVVKISATGEKIWDRTFGLFYNDNFSTLIPTADGGFLVGGTSSNYDFSERDATNYAVYKRDSNGNPQWSKTNIGGSGFDALYEVIQTADGGYLLGGSSNSMVSGDKTEPAYGGINPDNSSPYEDFWLVKLNDIGEIVWDKTIGGNRTDYLQVMKLLPNGSILLGGPSDSDAGFDRTEDNRCTGDCDEDRNASDYWFVSVNSAGEVQWDKALGGGGADHLTDVAVKGTDTFLLAGYSSSGIAGEKTHPSRGGNDYWVVQLGPEKNRVVSFTLINADTDQDVMEIKPGGFIDYALLGTRNINIRANTNPATVGSVVFRLNGVVSKENVLPYALGKDNHPNIKDYKPITLPLGKHVLTAVPYAAKNGTGAVGIPLTVPFTVVDGPTVLSLTLINASTDQDIRELKSGDVIDYGPLRSRTSVTVRANTYPETVGSVVFTLNNKKVQTENIFPYALAGDVHPPTESFLNYNPYPLPLGQHTLTATPFGAKAGGGAAGKPLTISFSVVELPVITNLRLINAETDMPVDRPLTGTIYYMDDIGTFDVNIEAITYPATVGSVVFKMDGVKVTTESVPPYAMFGDNYPNIDDLFKPYFIPTGPHTLEVTPYTGKNGSGMAGTTTIAHVTFRTFWYWYEEENNQVLSQAAAGAGGGFSFKAFPNPFTDKLTLQLDQADEPVQVALVDQLGRTVYERQHAQQTGQVELDLSAEKLPGGMYFLRLTAGAGEPRVLKLMKR